MPPVTRSPIRAINFEYDFPSKLSITHSTGEGFWFFLYHLICLRSNTAFMQVLVLASSQGGINLNLPISILNLYSYTGTALKVMLSVASVMHHCCIMFI